MARKVVVDIAKAHESVRVVCATQLGSVPHSPDFGVDWLKIIDEPMSQALRDLNRQIATQFTLHLPELKFVKAEIAQVQGESGKARVLVTWVPDGAEDEEGTLV
jgi:phage baseplate assembly protein W